jgi:hypothetical protein
MMSPLFYLLDKDYGCLPWIFDKLCNSSIYEDQVHVWLTMVLNFSSKGLSTAHVTGKSSNSMLSGVLDN